MRDPGFFRSIFRIFGQSPRTIRVDFRGIGAAVEAGRRLGQRPGNDPQLAALVDQSGTSEEVLDLVHAALSKNDARTQRALERAAKKLGGATRRPGDAVVRYLREFVSAVHDVKDDELREQRELASRYAWKAHLLDAKRAEWDVLLKQAAGFTIDSTPRRDGKSDRFQIWGERRGSVRGPLPSSSGVRSAPPRIAFRGQDNRLPLLARSA